MEVYDIIVARFFSERKTDVHPVSFRNCLIGIILKHISLQVCYSQFLMDTKQRIREFIQRVEHMFACRSSIFSS